MKLKPFLHRSVPEPAAAVEPESSADRSAPQPPPVAPSSPRYWSLLLPPGFTSDRR